MTTKNKRKSKAHKQIHATSPIEIIIREKAKKFVEAEKDYWKKRNAIRDGMQDATVALSLKTEQVLPADVSSTVYGLKDGVAFVRYKTFSGHPSVAFRVLPMTLAEWSEDGLLVPVENGELSLAKSGMIRGLGHMTFVNCSINGVEIPYAELSHMKYGDTINTPALERAILDFQLTLLGLQTQTAETTSLKLPGQETISKLKALSDEFEKILEDKTREEDIQKFLKTNSFVLHQSAETIPKQKLGEDFVTDFVLAATTTQGPSYFLVELERADHPVLNKDFSLTSPVMQAIKQTRDWDVWLESNKAYIQNKLPGFETPHFIVVVGRSTGFDDSHRAYMRSYNREWKNLELLTYDDVLHRFRATIEKLASTIGGQCDQVT